MSWTRRQVAAGIAAAPLLPAVARAAVPVIDIATPMVTPAWASQQRALLDVHTAACKAFYAHYFDARDHLQVVERWGANDGPDDAIEAVNDWPHLHALGGSDEILTLYRRAWEGYLDQYGRARTTQIPLGRRGMLVREFPPCIDWQHISEGLSTFNLMGLSTPTDRRLRDRARRFADFYTGADPSAPNYDRQRRLIRSLFNGSSGPLLRPATTMEWAGEPFDVTRFEMVHGERSYEETLAHYAEYGDVIGDSPLNLHSTTLGLNAWMLSGEARYRDWMIEYLDAWVARAKANNGILPSRVGLDGRIGGPTGEWWSGVYGWGFSPLVPQTGKREDRNRVPRAIVAFMNGTLATGDMRYMDVWRAQAAAIDAAGRQVDGVLHTPRMHGRQGWYSFTPGRYDLGGFERWYMTQAPDDRAAAGDHPWLAFLEGRSPAWPEQALATDLKRLRDRGAAMAKDRTTPETRLADNPLDYNPASVTALIQQTQGGLHIARPPWAPTSPNQGGAPLHARLRHFDPVRRRAGLPADVAVLVTAMDAGSVTATLVNCHPAQGRDVVVQGGAYGEHRIHSVAVNGDTAPAGGRAVRLRLAPGSGASVRFATARYSLAPTLAFPS
jgi:hypothetical protein